MRAAITILFMLATSVLVCGQSPQSAKALYVFVAQSVIAQQVEPAPAPEPDSDICDNCKGKGKVGDGTIERVCPVCDGTGKKTKQVSVSETPNKRNAIIEIWHGPNCPYCDALIELTPELEKSGWSIVMHDNASGPIPRSTIWVNGNATSVAGYRGKRAYYEAIRGSLVKRTEITVPAGFNIDDDPATDYRPRWNWRGNLQTHLMQPPHRLNTDGWTEDQREMYHDQWHDVFGSR